jgi:hypothetical protein
VTARRNGIEVEGLRETVRSLERFGVAVEDLKGVFGPIAAHAADVMRPLIPARSGKLRGSARGSKAKNVARVTVGSARLKYGGVVNYGWPRRGIRAADFTGKTDRALGDDAVRMLEAGLDDLLDKEQLT